MDGWGVSCRQFRREHWSIRALDFPAGCYCQGDRSGTEAGVLLFAGGDWAEDHHNVEFQDEQGQGAGVEDVAISNDRPIGVVARDVMTFLGWL